jgi:hypothetical protein
MLHMNSVTGIVNDIDDFLVSIGFCLLNYDSRYSNIIEPFEYPLETIALTREFQPRTSLRDSMSKVCRCLFFSWTSIISDFCRQHLF